jgi:hypothetical protein
MDKWRQVAASLSAKYRASAAILGTGLSSGLFLGIQHRMMLC